MDEQRSRETRARAETALVRLLQALGDEDVFLDASTERRRKLLDDWYRERLREAIPGVVAKWAPTTGVSVSRWSVRRMKTKWGSCNSESGHIWFNVELAKKHPDSLEYIAVHEMTHLLERGHGRRFVKLMDGFMPDWRTRRDQLNGSPLAREEWNA